MDSKRFDNWARSRALRLSRRDALRVLGVSGGAAALASTVPAAIAQQTCSFTIHAETAGGPSAPAIYDGTLQFTLGPDGAFTQASFTPVTGSAQSVSGQATGRAIDFQIALGPNQILAFSGAGSQPISTCPSDVAGIVTGPQPGDLGAWQTTGGPSTGGTTATGSTSTGSGTGSGSSGDTNSSSSNCPPPQTDCGQNCCSGGAVCTDANQGICACPDGTEQCGNSCVPNCSDGQPVDLDTCQCPPPEAACIENQQACQNHGQCCSGYCGGGTCFDCAGKVCGDFGCVDPNIDSQNCGNCGIACVRPQVCANGVCAYVCAPDGAICSDYTECCSQFCDNLGYCNSCSNIVSSGPGAPPATKTFCAPGVCADLRIDVDHCGACFNACQLTAVGNVCTGGVCVFSQT